MVIRSTKGSSLTWMEMDQNFLELQSLITGIDLTKYVDKTSTEEIGGYKTFTNYLRTPNIKSVTESNGGSYIDMNDGSIHIGTGLNSASGVPEISIENTGYGMSIIFQPSDTISFKANCVFWNGMNVNGDLSTTNFYTNNVQIQNNFMVMDSNGMGGHNTVEYNCIIDHLDSTNKIANTRFVQELVGTKANTATTLSGYGITDTYTKTQIDNSLSSKQATLTSGTNIKTVNGTSILGSGDITIAAGVAKARFTATEGQTAFICTGITLNDPLVYLNGILQDLTDVYTYSGSTVTFVNARVLNERIVVVQ